MHVNQTTLASTSASILWQPVHSPNGIITYYNVRYSARTHDSDAQVMEVNINGTGVQLKDLAPFTKYSLWVKAVNAVESSKLLTSAASAVVMVNFTTLSDGNQVTIFSC